MDAIGFDIFSPCEHEPPRGFDISEALGPGEWASLFPSLLGPGCSPLASIMPAL
jgi:hypothetical protein